MDTTLNDCLLNEVESCCEAVNDLKSSSPSSKHQEYIQQSQSPTTAVRKAEENTTMTLA